MAEHLPSRKFDLQVLEVLWLRKALEALRVSLMRSRDKEIVGSEIYQLRSREVDAVMALSQKLTGGV